MKNELVKMDVENKINKKAFDDLDEEIEREKSDRLNKEIFDANLEKIKNEQKISKYVNEKEDEDL